MSALGSLVVKLALNHAEYTQGLDKSSQEALKFAKDAQGTFDQIGKSVSGALSGVAVAAAGVVASIVGIDAMITRTLDAINVLDSLDQAAQKTGSSINDLSRIEQTARNFGDAFAPIEQSISRLAKGLAEINDPSNDAIRALDAINVSARDSNVELRTAADVYIDVAKSLQNYSDGAEKTAVANALFGKSGAELLPVLNNIAQGIDDVSGVSEESTKQAQEFNDALARVSSGIDGAFMDAAIGMLESLVNISSAFESINTQTQIFTFIGDAVGFIFKTIAVVGATAHGALVALGVAFNGIAQQVLALTNLDLGKAINIGNDYFNTIARSAEQHADFIKSVIGGEEKLNQSIDNGGMKKTIDFAMKLPEALAPATAATRSSIDASQAFMEKLQAEADQLGKTSAEVRKMEAAKLGLSNVADPLIDQIEQETAAAKQLEAQLRKVESITQANMTADERFSQTIQELNDLMAMPDSGLSVDTYNRAVQKAQDELQKSMDATKTAGKQAADEWDNIWRTSENTARMAFTAFAAHGTSAMESIGQSIKTAIIDVLYQLTVRKWVINVGAAIGMGGGIGGTGAAPGFGVTDILSAGSNLFSAGNAGLKSLIGRGASALGFSSFGAGASGAASAGVFGAGGRAFLGGAGTALGGTAATEFGAAASMGSMAASAAGPLVIAAAADMIFRSLAGDKTLGNKVVDSIPIIGSLGALLFGHGPMKFRQQVAIGTASEEGFDGRVTDVFRAKGGLLVGNKHKEQAAGNEAELLDLFSSTIKGYADASRGFAKNLGLDADVINNYSKTIRLESEKGKTLTEEAIRDMLSGIGNEMAQGLLPSIETLKKSGEDSMATLSRLNNEFVTLEQGAMNLGASAEYAKELISGLSIQTRSAYLEAAGGAEQFAADTASFSRIFLTEAERMAPSIKLVEDGLTSLGFSADLTKNQFKELVQTLLQSASDADKATGALLLHNNELFASVADYKDSLKQVTEQQKQAAVFQIDNRKEEQQKRVNSLLDYANNAITAIGHGIDKLFALSKAAQDAARQLSPQTVDEARANIISSLNFDKHGNVRGVGNINAIDPASIATLSNGSSSGFTNSFDFALSKAKNFAILQLLNSAADKSIAGERDALSAFASERNKLPKFANGGFHRGGLRIVGERGPELERTGASQITSNNDLKKAIGNDEIVKELRLLRAAVDKSEAPNRKVSKILKGVTQGGTFLRTKTATS